MAKHRNRLFELLEDGSLDAHTLARDLMGWISDDEVKEFAQANDIELFPEDDDDEDETSYPYNDEDEVREAFAERWDNVCSLACSQLASDKPAKREAFSLFVDELARDGSISDELANSVTLNDD